MTVIAFDVNETLLDLHGLDELFRHAFGDADLRPQWFAQMLQLCFVGGLTGQYVDFTTAQLAALWMLAERTGIPLSDTQAAAIVDGMTTLLPHPEVPPAPARLRGTSFTLVALTNSVQPVAEAQRAHAGLREFLDDVISADSVRKLKLPRCAGATIGRCGQPPRGPARHNRNVPDRGRRPDHGVGFVVASEEGDATFAKPIRCSVSS